MADGKQLWAIWQRLLAWFAPVFTRRGWVRFAQWVSGTVLCDEQHTITQEVTRLGLADQWRNWEHFAEYGAFDLRAAERAVMALVEREHPCRFARYHPAAVDDTKALRASRGVWGVCTFAHANGRDPKRPKVATAHNWVLMGDLAPPAAGWDEPWTYLPTASRLYLLYRPWSGLRKHRIRPSEPRRRLPVSRNLGGMAAPLFHEAPELSVLER